jgi:hypothetical protein
MLSAVIERERHQAADAQQAISEAADRKVDLARQAAEAQIADIEARTTADLAEARQEAQAIADDLAGVTADRDRLIGDLAAVTLDRDDRAANFVMADKLAREMSAAAGKLEAECRVLRDQLETARRQADHADVRADEARLRAEKAEAARDVADADRRNAVDWTRQLQDRVTALEAAKAQAVALAGERADQLARLHGNDAAPAPARKAPPAGGSGGS